MQVQLFAHKVAGVNMDIERLDNNKIFIKAYYKKSKKALFGNEVRLISMFDNRILKKGKLTQKGISFDIPKESYWVYVLVRDNDIVKKGFAPIEGFHKEVELNRIAVFYSVIVALLSILLSLYIAYIKRKKFKQSLR